MPNVIDLYQQGLVDLSKTSDERPAGDAGRIACAVLHHDGAGPDAEEGTIRWLNGASYDYSIRTYRDARAAVSTHKYIKRDGTIVKIVPENRRAWHAGLSAWKGREDLNDFSLGYEIANRGDGEAYTDAQYESIAQTLVYDLALYRFPDDWIVTHKEIRDEWLRLHPGTDGRKYDPYRLDIPRIIERMWQIRGAWPQGYPPRWVCSGQV